MTISSNVYKGRGSETPDPYPDLGLGPGDMNLPRGLVGTATSIGPKAVQQDAALHVDLRDVRIAVVADGVSSCPASQLAAQSSAVVVCSTLAAYALGHYGLSQSTVRKVVRHAQTVVHAVNTRHDYPAEGPATTLVAVVELPERLLIAHVGDGAAVVSTGSLRWFRNVLYPHVDPMGALTNYLGMRGDPVIEPSVIDLPKVWPDGVVALIGTDGALPEGEALATARAILEGARDRVQRSPGNQLDACGLLEDWVRQRQSTDDNRSLALILSDDAVAFWHAKQQRNSPDYD